jgi:hypothetical protein
MQFSFYHLVEIQDRTAMATPAATITPPAARLSRLTDRSLVNILRARLAKYA